jgi:hypothetical protein
MIGSSSRLDLGAHVTTRRRLQSTCLAFLGLLVAPHAAHAAELTAAPSCAVAGRPALNVTSSGWTPGSALTFTVGARSVGNGTADAFGAFSNAANPFTIPTAEASHPIVTRELTASDGAGTVAGPIAIRVVRREVLVRPQSRPRRLVNYRLYGFPPHQRLWLHIRRSNRTKASIRLGRPHGACGVLRKRMRYLPVHEVHAGTYNYWFENTRRFRASRTLYGYRIRVCPLMHANC